MDPKEIPPAPYVTIKLPSPPPGDWMSPHELEDLIRTARACVPPLVTFGAIFESTWVTGGDWRHVRGRPYLYVLRATMNVQPRDDAGACTIPLTMDTEVYEAGPNLTPELVLRKLFELGANLLLHEYAEQFKVDGKRPHDPHEGHTLKLKVRVEDPLKIGDFVVQQPPRKDPPGGGPT